MIYDGIKQNDFVIRKGINSNASWPISVVKRVKPMYKTSVCRVSASSIYYMKLLGLVLYLNKFSIRASGDAQTSTGSSMAIGVY